MRLLLAAALVAPLALAGCQGATVSSAFDDITAGRGGKPMPVALQTLLASKGLRRSSPIMLRIFKTENVLEVWKRKGQSADGPYVLVKSYEICKYSGGLGPKFKEGDRQAPEGFYEVGRRLMNPHSKYHLAINMGYPNAYDRAHGRTGSFLMIHGACSSAGCYSMTDPYAEEIYALARDAFLAGQKRIQIQAFPFRMTPKNMAAHRDHEHFAYWRMLKQGYDHFQLTRRPPRVNACGKQYVFNMRPTGEAELPGPMAKRAAAPGCPPMGMEKGLATAYMTRLNAHNRTFERLVAKAEEREVRELPDVSFEQAFPKVELIGEAATPPAADTPPAPAMPGDVPEVTIGDAT